MKLLFITARSDIGGGPKHVLDLLSYLPKQEFQISIAAPLHGELSSQYKRLSKHFIEIPHRRFSLTKAVRLLTFCKDEGIEIIHSHGRGAGTYSRFLALFGFKVIHTFHGVNQASKIKRLIESPMKFLTHKFICVSQSERAIALQQSSATEDQIRVVYNGTNVVEEKNTVINTRQIIIGYLARFDSIKGHSSLVDIIKSITEPNIKVFLAGDGEELESIKTKVRQNKLEEKIIFLGEISDIDRFFNQIDIYASFSQSEGMPLAVIEALMRGIPCLLSDIPAHREILKETPDLIFNSINFKEKLFKLIQNEFKKIDREEIISRFSMENMISNTTRIYLGK